MAPPFFFPYRLTNPINWAKILFMQTPAQRAFNVVHKILEDCENPGDADAVYEVINTLAMAAISRDAVLSMGPDSYDISAAQGAYDRWLEKARKKAFPEET